MCRTLLATLGFVALILVGATDLGACGDKFLVASLGGSFDYQAVVHPTRILVYWHAEAESDPEALSDSSVAASLEKSLEAAGHSVEVVWDSKSFYQQAASGGFEILMMEIADAREERRRIEGVSPDSTILPLMHFPSRREYSAAKKEFGQVVKTPATIAKLLSQIEKAGRRDASSDAD